MINLREIKNKIINKENFYFLIIILFIFGLDRYSKSLILSKFSENIFYINKFFNFDLIWNTGIGFGLLRAETNILYNSITFLIGIVIFGLILFSFKAKKIDKFSFSMVIGGALGNFYDRLIFNAVPDFIDLHYENYHWFTFNLADIFITIGVLLLILKGDLLTNK